MGELVYFGEYTKMKMIDVVTNEKICHDIYIMCKTQGRRKWKQKMKLGNYEKVPE